MGGVSLAVGTDFWQTLLRVGEVFGVFWLAGMGLRGLLRQGQPRPSSGTGTDAARGAHVDQKTPPMGVEDVARPSDGARRGGDES